MAEHHSRRWEWDDPIGRLTRTLDEGGLLAIPSESSYGLAADPWNPHGVDAVYEVKGREGGKALPVVAASLAQIESLGVLWTPGQRRFLDARWPAPLTAVLPLKEPLPASAGQRSIAVRIPAHTRLRGLLSRLGRPLTATSANRSGAPPIVEPGPLAVLLADCEAWVIDDGVLPGGPPSTLIAWRGDTMQILRAGAFELTDSEVGGTLSGGGCEVGGTQGDERPASGDESEGFSAAGHES